MSTEQPKALRLAYELVTLHGYPLSIQAAAELRRLHSLNAELLEALKLCEGNIKSLLASAHPKVYGEWLTFVSAAIAKATGDKT
jgi:hypothetical protein